MTEQEKVLVGGGEMGARMRALDWSQTSLGPVEAWPPALRTAVGLLLAALSPMGILWGAELGLLYNDSFALLIGDKHPGSLGAPFSQVFPARWNELGPLLDRVTRTGTAVSLEKQLLCLDRQGFTEEACFTFSYLPIRDEHGRVVGVMNIVSEATSQMLGERRFKLIRELSIRSALALVVHSVLHEVEGVLAQSGADVPFALLYRVEADSARLVLRSGLEAGGSLSPEALALGDPGSPWPLAEVLGSGRTRLVEGLRARGGALHAGPWPEPVSRALLHPLALGTGGARDAVLVVGLSPRLPLDEGYRDFLQVLSRQVAADVVRVQALEQEKLLDVSRLEAERARACFEPTDLTALTPGLASAEVVVKAGPGRAERLLQEAEAARGRLRGLIENAPALICVLRGPEHVYEMVNPSYQHLVGAGRELLGLPVARAIPEVVEQGFIQLLDDIYRTGEPFVGRELRLLVNRTGTGPLEEFFLDFVYQPRRDAHGQVEGVDLFGFDVTEQVRARQRVEALAQRLRESEERLRRVVDAAGVGLWELDAATGHIATDGHMLALMGLPPGTPLSLESSLLNVPVEDREPISRAITAALAGENEGRYHRVFRTFGRGDAPLRWVESRGQRMLGAGGQSVGVGGVMVDVTVRQEVEAVLSRQSRHNSLVAQVGLALSREVSLHEMLQACAQALADHMGAAFARLWLLDPKQNVLVLHASAGLHTHLEGPHARIPVGRYEVGLIAEDKQPYLSNEVLGDPREYGEEQQQQPPPPREGGVTFAGYPLLVGDRLVGVMALFARQPLAQDMLDILEQVTTSIALGVERLRAESELRTRIEFEQQLIGIVSHDLRNPLSAILMGASLLARRESQDERTLKSALRIQSSAERATRLVEDLLDFTQARLGGGLRIEPRPTDLHALTRGVMDEVEAAYPQREVEVRCEGDGRGAWDADRMSQVVQNLVTNALKYSPEDSLVRVTTRAEANEVSLSIANRGEPIPPEMLSSIFEPLRRGTAEVDKTGRSVGLGLYIVKSIVAAHGGRITVTSTQAEGTVFTVRLPRQNP